MTKQASTQASEMVPQNAGRRSIVFQNTDGTDSVYIKKERPGNNSVSSTDFDYKLFPASTLFLSFQSDGEEAIKERWTMVASANTPRVAIVETEDFKR